MERESTEDWATRVKSRVTSLESHWINLRKHAQGPEQSTEATAFIDTKTFQADPLRVQALEEFILGREPGA